jgi:hypothetical protein
MLTQRGRSAPLSQYDLLEAKAARTGSIRCGPFLVTRRRLANRARARSFQRQRCDRCGEVGADRLGTATGGLKL